MGDAVVPVDPGGRRDRRRGTGRRPPQRFWPGRLAGLCQTVGVPPRNLEHRLHPYDPNSSSHDAPPVGPEPDKAGFGSASAGSWAMPDAGSSGTSDSTWAAPESGGEAPSSGPVGRAGDDFDAEPERIAGRVRLPVRLRPMTTSDLLDGGFAILKTRPGAVFGVSAAIIIPFHALQAFLARNVVNDSGNTFGSLLNDTSTTRSR